MPEIVIANPPTIVSPISVTRTSKKIVSIAVETLTDLLDSDPRVESLLNHTTEGLSPLQLVNAILSATAEGATIVAARETDGTIAGFMPKRSKTVADTAVAAEKEPEK